MKRLGILAVLLLVQFFAVSVASAGDFDWLNNLNIRAEADESGFRAQLMTRFRIGDAEVNAVIGKVDKKSDAYMVLRLGELSGAPVKKVLKVYKKKHKKGWGVVAKKLGIKPGSEAFHALKRGHDLTGNMKKGKEHPSSKGKGNGKGNGMGNGKGNGMNK